MEKSIPQLAIVVAGFIGSSVAVAAGSGSAILNICTPTSVVEKCKMSKGENDVHSAIQWDCKLRRDNTVVDSYLQLQSPIPEDEAFSQTITLNATFLWEKNFCVRNQSDFLNNLLEIDTGWKCEWSGTDPNNPPE